MTEAELQEIEDRCNKATAGPWLTGVSLEQAWGGKDENYYGQVPPGEAGVCPLCLMDKSQLLFVRVIEDMTYHLHKDDCWTKIYADSGDLIVGQYDYDMGGVASTKEDAEFIVHARQDLPALIAEIKKIRAAKAVIEKALDKRDIDLWFALSEEGQAVENALDILLG